MTTLIYCALFSMLIFLFAVLHLNHSFQHHLKTTTPYASYEFDKKPKQTFYQSCLLDEYEVLLSMKDQNHDRFVYQCHIR